MTQLAAVQLTDRRVKLGEKPQPGRCDADQNAPPVLVFAAAVNQPPFFQAIEEPGDVGFAMNHAGGNFAAKETLGGAAKNAQDVVGRRGKLMLFQEPGRATGKTIGSTSQIDEEIFFRAGKRRRGMG